MTVTANEKEVLDALGRTGRPTRTTAIAKMVGRENEATYATLRQLESKQLVTPSKRSDDYLNVFWSLKDGE